MVLNYIDFEPVVRQKFTKAGVWQTIPHLTLDKKQEGRESGMPFTDLLLSDLPPNFMLPSQIARLAGNQRVNSQACVSSYSKTTHSGPNCLEL